MNDPRRSTRCTPPRRTTGRLAIALSLVLLGAAGGLSVGLHRTSTSTGVVAAPVPQVAPPVRPRATPPAVTSAAARPAEAPLSRSVPVELRIPALGLRVAVPGLGLNADRTVQVPADPALPGWFRLGPAPGQVGSAVILGHVDSARGPAVFHRLRLLRPGDRIQVLRADRAVAEFAVLRVVTYLKADFPARRIYGAQGYSALNLVTCGGLFDRQTDSYLANLVVYTKLVANTG